MQLSTRSRLILLWFLCAVIAVLVCTMQLPSAHVKGEWVPVGNDSFYHARRILDTAANPSAFYEYDTKIHAPEGSLLTWPWVYDYTMGWITRLGMKATGFSGPPIQFLDWIPTAFVIVPIALIMLIARRLGLSIWSAALAALCVACSPLTQVLNAVGQVDHHWAEYIFVLSSIALGLRWFQKPEDAGAAAFLGVVLGISQGIHNGQFILQIPVLLLMFLWWLQNIRLPLRSTLFFAGALIGGTLAVLVFSLPFRLGRFEYYTLSWFHLYIAMLTAVGAVLLSKLPKTNRNLVVLALVALVAVLPLVHQSLMAHTFLMGTNKRLKVIAEMQSILQLVDSRIQGFMFVSGLYSLLIWLWPLTYGLCLYRAWLERRSPRLFFWVCAVCGLTLIVMQFRLHYFGSFALALPWLVLIEEKLVGRWPARRKLVMLATTLVLLLIYALPLRYSVPSQPGAGGDENFNVLRYVLAALQEACAKEPGVVLADNDAGHLIRYYTECSVIANNFLLTKQHFDKIELLDRLLSTPADKLPSVAPYVRYVLIRPAFVRPTDKGIQYMTFNQDGEGQLITDLLLQPVADVSSKYTLLKQVSLGNVDPKKPIPYARLWEIVRPDATHTPQVALDSSVPDNSRH